MNVSGLTKQDLAAEATRRYLRAVQSLAEDGRRNRHTRRAAAALAKTLEAALKDGPGLGAERCPFDITSLRQVPEEDRALFVNQYSLGVGSDNAPVLVLGTESAEDPADADTLAFHALYSAIVLTESRPDLLRHLVKDSAGWAKVDWKPGLRRYDINPDDYVGVRNVRGSSTWELVAKVVSPDPAVWQQLLGGHPGPGLGALAYQIERSAVPAFKQLQGRPPTGERVQFMTDVVMPRLRNGAKVLLLHGFGGSLEMAWRPWDRAVIAAFLGIPEFEVAVDWQRPAGTYLGFLERGDRRVIFARALSGAVSSDYISAVRQLVRPESLPSTEIPRS